MQPTLRRTRDRLFSFVVKIAGDWLKLSVVWVLMWAFAELTDHFRVEGWASDWIHKIHHVGSVAAVAILIADLTLSLIVELYQGLREEAQQS